MSFECKRFCIDILPPWYKIVEEIMPFSESLTLNHTERIFPVSLRVNTESRAETMQHCSFVSLSDVFDDLPGLPKRYLNLGLDCLFISKELCSSPSLQDMYQKWLNDLEVTGKGGLARVKDLEVKEFRWDQSKSTPDHRYEVRNEQLRPGTEDAVILPLLKFILRLIGLQVLCLTWHIPLVMHAHQKSLKLEESRAMMQEFLERHKDNFVGGRVPEVQIRYWNMKQERYVYQAPNSRKDLQ
jgi:hypothetical protein